MLASPFRSTTENELASFVCYSGLSKEDDALFSVVASKATKANIVEELQHEAVLWEEWDRPCVRKSGGATRHITLCHMMNFNFFLCCSHEFFCPSIPTCTFELINNTDIPPLHMSFIDSNFRKWKNILNVYIFSTNNEVVKKTCENIEIKVTIKYDLHYNISLKLFSKIQKAFSTTEPPCLCFFV